VPIDLSRLRNPRRDAALVGAAGPGANLAIAAGLAALIAVNARFEGAASESLLQVAATGIFVNAMLAVFNLLPIPPLDGSRVVQYFLPRTALAAYRRLEQYGLLIIVALLYFAPQIQRPLLAAVLALIAVIGRLFGVEAPLEAALTHALNA
jgi:Zn-dependent protease